MARTTAAAELRSLFLVRHDKKRAVIVLSQSSVVSDTPQMHMHAQQHQTTDTHKERTSPNQKKKKTTLPAGIRHTPDTSSTRTTPPSVSRGRISVESPTQDTGPFTLPLSGEGTGRAAGRVDMKRNNLKHTAFAFFVSRCRC